LQRSDASEETPEEAENMKLRSVLMTALKTHHNRKHLLVDTPLSRFIRDASSAEKKKVYQRVMAKATEDQQKVLDLAQRIQAKNSSHHSSAS